MDSTTNNLIARTEAYAKEHMGEDASGHDWWHVHRVRNLALAIAKVEGADASVVELAALLHDIADFKFTGDEEAGAETSTLWLRSLGADEGLVSEVSNIVRHISFKGAGVADVPLGLEGQCVRDADRLDAMGAIGIARAFAYGGRANRPIHDPESGPQLHATREAYRSNKGATVNHFHEKLLLLKGRMGTTEGRRLAEGRHQVMVEFLEEFDREWSQR